MKITPMIKKLFGHEGDEPHKLECEDGTIITFGISDAEGNIRRATPEDYPPGVWPPVRVGAVTLDKDTTGKEDGQKT